MAEVSIRALQGSDVSAARALISAQFAGTPYEARLLEQLALATTGDDPECRALVAGDVPRGLVLFGSVAGANSVVKLHALSGDPSALRALAAEVRDIGARLVVCELADDTPFDVTGQILRELGFEEDGCVADYFREGVALLVITWRSP
jgi:hypothetical protein